MGKPKLTRDPMQIRLRQQADRAGWALWEVACDDAARHGNEEAWLVELEKRAIMYSVAHRILVDFNAKRREERHG